METEGPEMDVKFDYTFSFYILTSPEVIKLYELKLFFFKNSNREWKNAKFHVKFSPIESIAKSLTHKFR